MTKNTKTIRELKTIFINGKQVRVKANKKVDGVEIEEFILNNYDPIFLHQNKMWEHIEIDTNTKKE